MQQPTTPITPHGTRGAAYHSTTTPSSSNLSMAALRTPTNTNTLGMRNTTTPIGFSRPPPGQAMAPNTPSASSSFGAAAHTPKRPRPPTDPANRRARTRRRVTDNVHVAKALPMEESEVYLRLVEFERELDHAISRRRKAILSAIQKPQLTNTQRRTLRVWVYNLHHNQPLRDPVQRAQLAKGKKERQKLDEEALLVIDKPTPGVPDVCVPPSDGNNVEQSTDDNDPPSWTLRVYASLLPPPPSPLHNNPPPAQQPRGKQHSDIKFSQCIDRVVVELDRKFYTQYNVVEWRAAGHEEHQAGTIPGGAPGVCPLEDKCVDGLELKRIGSAECSVKLLLYPASHRSHFRVLPPLGVVLGVERATRPQLLTMLWTYIQTHDLLDTRGGGETVNNDAELTRVFGVSKMELSSLGGRVTPFLAPLPPIEITHTIRLNGDVDANEACYDIDLEVDENKLSPQASGLPMLNAAQIATWNAEIDKNIKWLQEHKDKRDFMVAFSHSPIDVMAAMITSQAKDAMGRSNSDLKTVEEKLYHQTFYQPFMHEAVLKYLNDQLSSVVGQRHQGGSASGNDGHNSQGPTSHLVNHMQYRR